MPFYIVCWSPKHKIYSSPSNLSFHPSCFCHQASIFLLVFELYENIYIATGFTFWLPKSSLNLQLGSFNIVANLLKCYQWLFLTNLRAFSQSLYFLNSYYLILYFISVFSNTSPGSPRLLDHIARGSDSAGLRWGSKICVSSKFPGDADDAHLETTFCKLLHYSNPFIKTFLLSLS